DGEGRGPAPPDRHRSGHACGAERLVAEVEGAGTVEHPDLRGGRDPGRGGDAGQEGQQHRQHQDEAAEGRATERPPRPVRPGLVRLNRGVCAHRKTPCPLLRIAAKDPKMPTVAEKRQTKPALADVGLLQRYLVRSASTTASKTKKKTDRKSTVGRTTRST